MSDYHRDPHEGPKPTTAQRSPLSHRSKQAPNTEHATHIAEHLPIHNYYAEYSASFREIHSRS